MKKFVMLDSHTLPDADFHQEKELLAEHNIDCVLAKCKTEEEVIACAQDADCIGDNYFRIDGALLDKLPNCKAIIRYGIGYDVVDVDACTQRGVWLRNLPEYCVTDVATHTMAMMLDLVRKTTLFDRHTRAGDWDVGYGYEVHRLEALTLGLVGFGNIARLFSKYAKVFGTRVVASDPFVAQEIFQEYGVEKISQEELFAKADIVSVHVPIIPSTHHLICRETIAGMKDGVMILNTSRGPIVDITALVEGLHSGKVCAAGLDVVEGEPISDPHHPLWACENLVVTPHTAYNSVEASDAQHTQVAETAVAILSGQTPRNIVNRKQLGL